MTWTPLRSLTIAAARRSSSSFRYAHTARATRDDECTSQSSSSESSGHLNDVSDRKGKDKVQHGQIDDQYRFPERGRDGDLPDPFEVMALDRNASQREVKEQYYRLALILHPDSSHPSSSPSNFATLNRAYTLLSSPSSRSNYLTFGQGWSSTGGTTHDPYAHMRSEVMRRARGGSGQRGGNGDGGRGAWAGYGVDGKWHTWPEAGMNGTGEPKYMSHTSFMSVLVLVSIVVAWVHYHRIDSITETRRDAMRATNVDASHALAVARREARLHGQHRRELIRRKANENRVLKEVDKLENPQKVESSHLSLPPPSPPD